jgi:hypothetical protein
MIGRQSLPAALRRVVTHCPYRGEKDNNKNFKIESLNNYIFSNRFKLSGNYFRASCPFCTVCIQQGVLVFLYRFHIQRRAIQHGGENKVGQARKYKQFA